MDVSICLDIFVFRHLSSCIKYFSGSITEYWVQFKNICRTKRIGVIFLETKGINPEFEPSLSPNFEWVWFPNSIEHYPMDCVQMFCEKIRLIKVVLLCMWSQNMRNTCSEVTSTSKNWIDVLIFNTSFTEKSKVRMYQTFDLVQLSNYFCLKYIWFYGWTQLFIILEPKQVYCYCYKSQSIHQHHQFCKYLLLSNAALQELPLHIHVVASYPLQNGRTGSTSCLSNFYCIREIMTWYHTMFGQLLEQ